MDSMQSLEDSNLTKTIDEADSAILSNTTNIRLRKKLNGTVSTNPKGYTFLWVMLYSIHTQVTMQMLVGL